MFSLTTDAGTADRTAEGAAQSVDSGHDGDAVTLDHHHHHHQHVHSPFFHGTTAELTVGAELVFGYGSNFQQGRVSNNIYFTSVLETAVWGAELATALAGIGMPGRIYVVEPLGPFEDDPNVTDKKFPGNPTRSYRSRHPLRIVWEVRQWQGHDVAVLNGMLESLRRLREQGRDVIED